MKQEQNNWLKAMLRGNWNKIVNPVARIGKFNNFYRPAVGVNPSFVNKSFNSRGFATYDSLKIRNVAIIAHVDHGKAVCV